MLTMQGMQLHIRHARHTRLSGHARHARLSGHARQTRHAGHARHAAVTRRYRYDNSGCAGRSTSAYAGYLDEHAKFLTFKSVPATGICVKVCQGEGRTDPLAEVWKKAGLGEGRAFRSQKFQKFQLRWSRRR